MSARSVGDDRREPVRVLVLAFRICVRAARYKVAQFAQRPPPSVRSVDYARLDSVFMQALSSCMLKDRFYRSRVGE